MCIGGIIASRCRRKVLLPSGLVQRSEMLLRLLVVVLVLVLVVLV